MTPFRSAAFRWLWCSTLASSGSQTMERTATAWLALQSGGGAFAVGLVFAARSLPSLLFGLAAGTVADRADRRRQLLAVSGAALPLMAAIGWLVGMGTAQVWQVIAISFAAGCLQVCDTPARQALVLDTVPRTSAPNAMALNALAARGASALGALGAGVLILRIGVGHCYFVIAAGYGVAALLIAALRAPHGERVTVVHPPFGRALRDAARLIVDIPAVRTLTISGVACEIFAFSYGSALPVVARDVLRSGPEGLGTLNAATSIGGVVALALLSTLAGRMRREPLLGAIFVLYGASLLVLATTRDLAVAAAVLVVTGLCAGAFDVLQQTLIQMAVPDRQRGRAVGIWVLGVGSAPVGNLEMGGLIAVLGAPGALLINGTLAVASAGILLARSPRYRWTLRARLHSGQLPPEREWLKRRWWAILPRMDIPICPHCGRSSSVRRWGHNRAGTQRYRCLACRRNFTPAPKEQGHGAVVHEQAVRLYLGGMSLRAIGRLLGVVHQSVANWVAAHAATLPADPTDHPPPDREGEGSVEVDELETFIGGEKPADQRHRGGGACYPTDRRAAGDVGR